MTLSSILWLDPSHTVRSHPLRLFSLSPPELPGYGDPTIRSALELMMDPNPSTRMRSGSDVLSTLLGKSELEERMTTPSCMRAYFSRPPLQGRDEFFEVIRDTLDKTAEPSSDSALTLKRLFLLGGEAGIGKSRFLDERRRRLTQLKAVR